MELFKSKAPEAHDASKYFDANSRVLVLKQAEQELENQNKTKQVSNLKFELFLDCFIDSGLADENSVKNLEDLKKIDENLYNSLEKTYTEDVLVSYLYNKDKAVA